MSVKIHKDDLNAIQYDHNVFIGSCDLNNEALLLQDKAIELLQYTQQFGNSE